MTAGMTITSSIEVEEYYEAVRHALVDLPAGLRDDLVEDLPDHLTEVLAEGEGSLRDRLGEPAAYAEELRSAAGLDSVAPPPRFARAAQSVAALADRLDLRLGRLAGYPRLKDAARAIQPGWWVLRGWIAAQYAGGVRDGYTWDGWIPAVGGSRLTGLAVTVAFVGASVWLGRRAQHAGVWPRRIAAVASLVIAWWALAVLAGTAGSAQATSSYGAPVEDNSGLSTVSDIYVYDKDGHLVPGARLFDQNGQSLQLGSGECQTGGEATGANSGPVDPTTGMQVWTYPVCPSDPGPFRAGPGPSAPSSSVSPSTGN